MSSTFLILLYSTIPKNQLLPANNLQLSIESNKNNDSSTAQKDVDLYSRKGSSGIDSSSKSGYNGKRKSYYNQYETLALQWANSAATKEGDSKWLFDARNNCWNEIVADNSDEGYGV